MLFLLEFVVALLLLTGAGVMVYRRRGTSMNLSILAASAAFVALLAAAIYFITRPEGPWQASVRLAWTGLEANTPGAAVRIGCGAADGGLEWPNNASSPCLTWQSTGGQKGTMTLEGNGAFLLRDGQALNGEPIEIGKRTKLNGLSLERSGRKFLCFLPSCDEYLQIVDGDGNRVGEEIPVDVRKTRVILLLPRIEPVLAELRRSNDQAKLANALRLEMAAGKIHLFISSDTWRAVDETTHFTGDADAGRHTLEVFFPLRRMTIHPGASDAGASAIVFHPQWIWNSVLPPSGAEGTPLRPMTVTALPRPGDFAFTLPVARDAEAEAPRVDLVLDGEKFYAPDEALQPKLPNGSAISEKRVDWGPVSVRLAVIKQNPRLWLLLLVLIPALVLYALACFLTFRAPLSGTALVASVCLLHVLWTLLLLRLLLALRYGADASRVDSVSVEAVAFSMLALLAFPVTLAIGFRISVDTPGLPPGRARWAAAMELLAILALTAVLAFFTPFLANQLWQDLPARYLASPFRPLDRTLFLFAMGLWLVVLIIARYLVDGGPVRLPAPLDRLFRLAGAVRFYRPIAGQVGPEMFWPLFGGTQRMPGGPAAHRAMALWTISLFLLMLVGLTATRFALQMTGGTKFVQEILSPLLLCWIPAVLWISARAHFPPGSSLYTTRFIEVVHRLTAGLVLVGVPVFFVPFIMKDAGGVISTVSVFLPLSLLLISGWGPLRVCGVPMLWLVLAVAAGTVTWIQFGAVLEGPMAPGEMGSRVIAYRGGEAAQTKVLHNPTVRDSEHGSITSGKIAAGIQHAWENRAMIHQGGWWGLGFGHAPNRRSQIPQDTLQADSTFSFFIASEHGWIGAFSLLLLYSIPLLILLLATETDIDIGRGVAMIVAGSLLLEALAHAAMNAGLMPFSGRNLPLLSANSPTDAVRWLILISLALRALAWSQMSGADTKMLSRPVIQFRGTFRRWADLWQLGSRPRFFLEQSVFPVAALTAIAVALIGNVRDPSLAAPFQWRPLLERIQDLAKANKIRFDFDQKRIVLDPELRKNGSSLLEQEVARFNALPESVRLHGAHATTGDTFHVEMRGLRGIADYDALLERWKNRYRRQTSSIRPLLLELEPPDLEADTEGNFRFDKPIYTVTPNSSWNSSVSFDQPRGPGELVAIGYGAQAEPVWTVSGEGFRFALPAAAKRAVGRPETMKIFVRQGRTRVTQRPVPYAGAMRIEVEGTRGRTATFGTVRSEAGKLRFTTGTLEVLVVRNGKAGGVLGKAKTVELELGDEVRQRASMEKGVQLAISIGKATQRALIGPAWVMGNWRLAVNDESSIPWSRYMVPALAAERKRFEKAGKDFREHYKLLTLRPPLQSASQQFAEEVGRSTYDRYLKIINSSRWGRRRGQEPVALPPRVALAIVSLPNGEVRAIGGWPRMSSSPAWAQTDSGDWKPPSGWLSDAAPPVIRRRYEIERNFDPLVMGSATKPLWGTVVERLHPGLSGKLRVRGAKEPEEHAFGIQIPGGPWKTEFSHGSDGSEWCDFTGFLTYSNNRYQVRQGLLALALPGADGVPQDAGASDSTAEAMGDRRPWRRTPKFDPEIGFSASQRDKVYNLQQSRLAKQWESMYGVPAENRTRIHRSFWTGDALHEEKLGHRGLDFISPPAPNFAWNTIETPRIYISMLLGGATNRWANVDFAGAYATAVTGRPYVPHILEIPNDQVIADPARDHFWEIAEKLHPGSEGAVTQGTLRGTIKPTVLDSLRSIAGVKIYAKTGTLDSGGPDATETSRVGMAIVRWDASGRVVKKGVAISLVIENSHVGEAARRLGAFLEENLEQIRRELVD